MQGLTSLILGADLNETMVNVVAIVFIIEFIGVVFGLIGNINKK